LALISLHHITDLNKQFFVSKILKHKPYLTNAQVITVHNYVFVLNQLKEIYIQAFLICASVALNLSFSRPSTA
jgi:hypothetical protein